MWVLFAFASALFAGITAILAKIGIQETDSYLVTALRTIIVAVFAWGMVLIAGSWDTISMISAKTWLFLCLSGLATGGSWICYFKALQLGDVNKVAPIDKSSTVFTMILAFLFLGEGLTMLKAGAMLLIMGGTFLMIKKQETVQTVKISSSGRKSADKNSSWLVFAVLSAVFASLTAILGKIGISGVESNLGTAIRTMVVLAL